MFEILNEFFVAHFSQQIGLVAVVVLFGLLLAST